MSRTYKDQKKNKKWDKRNNEYDAGFMKAFKRASNKKMRRTPITSPCLDVRYSEQTVTFKVLKNVGIDIWSVDYGILERRGL